MCCIDGPVNGGTFRQRVLHPRADHTLVVVHVAARIARVNDDGAYAIIFPRWDLKTSQLGRALKRR